MRYTQAEKMEIIDIVDNSEIGVNKTLIEMGIHKSTFYNWYERYLEGGYDGLAPKKRAQNSQWNRIPDYRRQEVVELALEQTELSSRELAFDITDNRGWSICESSVYKILKARGLITAPAHMVFSASSEFKDKTTFVNQMWQTDFTYFRVIGWGWYYLSTVLDDYSRYIISWELCTNMGYDDAQRSVNATLKSTGLNKADAPRLLSDNGPCYISKDLKGFLDKKGIDPVRGAPNHPQTQGKIERYHRSMKNVIKLEHYYSPDELRNRLAEWVDWYNNQRYHASLNNLTPASVYFGKGERILKQRELTKIKTMKQRRMLHRKIMSHL
jgi:transposase InsO family protein